MRRNSALCTRRTHSPAFKVQVALAALRDDKTMAALCKVFELHAHQDIAWKRQLLAGAIDVLGLDSQAVPPADLDPLRAKIGQLALENELLKHALSHTGSQSAKP